MNSQHYLKQQPQQPSLLFPQPFSLPTTYPSSITSHYKIHPISFIKSRLMTRISKKFNSTPSLFSKLQANQILNPLCPLSFRYKERLIQIDEKEFLKQLYSGYDILPKLKLIITILSFLIKSYPNYLPLSRMYPVMQRNMKSKQHLINSNYLHLINEYKLRYSKFDLFFDQSFYSSDSDSHSVIHYDPIFYPKKVNKSDSIGSVENLVKYIHNIEEGYDDIGNGCLLTPTLKPKKSRKRRIGAVFSFIKNMVNFEGVGSKEEGASMQEKFELFLLGKKGAVANNKNKIKRNNSVNYNCNNSYNRTSDVGIIKEDDKDGSFIIENHNIQCGNNNNNVNSNRHKRNIYEVSYKNGIKGVINVNKIYGRIIQEKLSKKYLDDLKQREEEHNKKQKYKKTKTFFEVKRQKKIQQYETTKELSKELLDNHNYKHKHKPSSSLLYLQNKFNTPTKPLSKLKLRLNNHTEYDDRYRKTLKAISIEKLPHIKVIHKKLKSMEHKPKSPINASTSNTINNGIQVNENKFLYKIPLTYMYSSSTMTTVASPISGSGCKSKRTKRNHMKLQSLDSGGTVMQRFMCKSGRNCHNNNNNNKVYKTVSDVDYSSSNYYVLTTNSGGGGGGNNYKKVVKK